MHAIPEKVESPEMFSRIAHRYDLLNHVLSMNVDRYWRRQLVKSAAVADGGRVLDACTGTGDVAIGFARALGDGTIIGVDRSSGMLAIGRAKLERLDLSDRIELREADVLDLPFDDGEFDAVTIAFGLRNLPDYERGLSELTRVLKPGGRLVVLEFSPPAGKFALKGYNFYLQRVIPVVGGILSGSREAYRYLATSIGDFLPRDRILELLASTRLSEIHARRMTGGIAYLFSGVRGAP